MQKLVRYMQKGILSLSHPKVKKNKLKAVFLTNPFIRLLRQTALCYAKQPFVTLY